MFADDDQFAQLGWEGSDLVTNGDFSAWTGDDPDNWTVSAEDANNYITQNGNAAQIISDGVGFIQMGQTAILSVGKKYKVQYEIKTNNNGSLTTDAFGSNYPLVSTVGIHELIEIATAIDFDIERSGITDITITNIIITEIGDTVEKILDLGSGGADSITYYNATQATATKQATRTQYGLLADGIDDEYDIGTFVGGGTPIKAIVWKARFDTDTEEILTLGTNKDLVLDSGLLKYNGSYLGFSVYGTPSTTEQTVMSIVFDTAIPAVTDIKLFTDGIGFGKIEMEYIKFFNDMDVTYNVWDDDEIWDDSETWSDIETLY
jgi:hypothetical protein